MMNLVSLRSLLSTIPKPLYEQAEESDFLFWFREALRMLPSITATESKVEIFEIIDSKVTIPKYVKTINKVTWMYKDPDSECLQSFNECVVTPTETQDLLPQLCRPEIYYKMFLDSPYYKNNYTLLKFIGTDKSLLCKDCPNMYCDNSNNFVVTKDKILYTNLTCGFLCVEYDTELCDEAGQLLIPDIQEVHNFLQSYAIKRHLEERMFGKEEGINQMYQMYSSKSDTEYRKAKGVILLRQLNPHTIQSINEGWFMRLIKLPSIYIYDR